MMRLIQVIFCMSAIFSNVSADSKVVVIGGGIAGLTAAYRLHQEGVDVELYEARGRIGGRIFTAQVNGHMAELGGQNITDGGEAPNLNRLIDEFGLQCVSSRVYLKHSYFNGVDLIPISELLNNKKIDPESLKKDLQQVAASSSNMKEILESILAPQDPLYKVLAVRLAAYEGGNVEKLSPLYVETLFHILMGGICSVHQDPHVDLISIEGGNALLPQKLGEELRDSLHLNMPLAKVSKGKRSTFQLTFQNGTEVEADQLVLAIPCSVYEQIAFEEGIIPPEKLEAIHNVQYGTNAKILLPFTTPPSATTGLINDELVAFFNPAQQMLTIYYTGTASSFSPNTIGDAYSLAYPMIKRGFDNCPSFTTPLYAKDEPSLSYEGAVGYSWPNDPYAKGTYSYIASGQESLLTATTEENGETFKTLFAPIQARLYFAGEHASILFDVPGTMEAACESGERVARAILHHQKEGKQ